LSANFKSLFAISSSWKQDVKKIETKKAKPEVSYLIATSTGR